jgi:hypothetical protein
MPPAIWPAALAFLCGTRGSSAARIRPAHERRVRVWRSRSTAARVELAPPRGRPAAAGLRGMASRLAGQSPTDHPAEPSENQAPRAWAPSATRNAGEQPADRAPSRDRRRGPPSRRTAVGGTRAATAKHVAEELPDGQELSRDGRCGNPGRTPAAAAGQMPAVAPVAGDQRARQGPNAVSARGLPVRTTGGTGDQTAGQPPSGPRRGAPGQIWLAPQAVAAGAGHRRLRPEAARGPQRPGSPRRGGPAFPASAPRRRVPGPAVGRAGRGPGANGGRARRQTSRTMRFADRMRRPGCCAKRRRRPHRCRRA